MKRLSLILVTLLMVSSAFAQWHFTDASSLMGSVPAATCVAWGDVNNDGYPDLFVGTDGTVPWKLFISSGATHQFTDQAASYGLNISASIRHAQLLDVDKNGRLDLFVLRNDFTQVQLYKQTGSHFQATLIALGLSFESTVASAQWIDINHDGNLDLILSTGSTANEPPMIITQQSGRFTLQRSNPFDGDLNGVGAMAFCDYDHDGNVDMFTGFGSASEEAAHFYRNMGNNDYFNYTEKCGITPKLGMQSAVWFDFNNDMYPDLFLPSTLNQNVQLYKNRDQGGYRIIEPISPEDMTTLARLARNSVYADAVDGNLDGNTDLFIVKAGMSGVSMLMNRPGKEWLDVAAQIGLPVSGINVRSAAWADYDGDGDLDLAMATSSGLRFYRNDLLQHRPYLRLNLQNTSNTTPIIGASAWIQYNRGGQFASTAPSTWSSGGNENTLTFVSSAVNRDGGATLTIRWPNGNLQTLPVAQSMFNTTLNLHQPTFAMPPAPETPPVAVEAQSVSPNPFNPSTGISFTLPNAADVTLKIYNTLGQEVADLEHGPLSAGSHRYTFNASTLPSGMYFSRLTANGTTDIKRMLLAK